MNSVTQYITVFGAYRLEFINMTFDGVRYSDSAKYNSYMIRYDDYGLHTSYSSVSLIKDTKIINSEVNLF